MTVYFRVLRRPGTAGQVFSCCSGFPVRVCVRPSDIGMGRRSSLQGTSMDISAWTRGWSEPMCGLRGERYMGASSLHVTHCLLAPRLPAVATQVITPQVHQIHLLSLPFPATFQVKVAL